MTEQDKQLEALTEMRDLMNRSSRFLSLSGISGVCAGVFALIGAAAAWWHFHTFLTGFSMHYNEYEMLGLVDYMARKAENDFYLFFFADAGLVLIASLVCGWFFSKRKADKAGIPFWDAMAWRVLANLMLPLAAGGIFCLILFYHGLIGLIAPCTLIFYGLGLLNASKYTVHDIRYLGLCQVVLGLLASVYIGYGLLFWAFGFGILHIVYGAVMYFKYER